MSRSQCLCDIVLEPEYSRKSKKIPRRGPSCDAKTNGYCNPIAGATETIKSSPMASQGQNKHQRQQAFGEHAVSVKSRVALATTTGSTRVSHWDRGGQGKGCSPDGKQLEGLEPNQEMPEYQPVVAGWMPGPHHRTAAGQSLWIESRKFHLKQVLRSLVCLFTALFCFKAVEPNNVRNHSTSPGP